MKQWLIFIIFLLTSLFWLPRETAYALCRQPKDVTDQATQCKYKTTYQLGVFGQANCKAEDATARGINGDGSYELCCEYPTEVNADDSLRAPLCGSSEELFQANNTCWSCGGDLRCAGANQSALALNDPTKTTIDLSMSNRSPVSSGDGQAQMEKVWVVTSPPTGKFSYNGSEYDAGGRRIIFCTDNVGGCGATDTQCTNELYSCFDNHGGDCGTRSKPQECQAYSFTSTSFYTPGSTSGINTAPSSPKACINVGDHLNEFDSVKNALGSSGWVYIMAIPEWMDQIAAFIAENPDYSYMIRIHYPGRELTSSYMEQWASAIEKSAAKLQGARRILLMPVNEPNNPGGGRAVDPFTAQVAISALVQSLDQKGLLNTVVGVTSPMWDLSQSDSVYGYVDQMGGATFLKQFAAVAFASYGHYGDGNGGTFAGLNLMNGKISDFMSHYNLSMPTIIPETGVDVNGTVTYAPASGSIVDFLGKTTQEWANTMATCIFSYNPDTHADPNWIYSDQNVLNALKGGQASTYQLPRTSGLIPKSSTSTISYQSCTEFGTPDVTSIIPIPNLIDFGAKTKTNEEGKSFLSDFLPKLDRPIKGILGFLKNRLDEPSVYEKFGKQLDAFMPYQTPADITVGQIVQEYTHSVSGLLCFASDNNIKKAFPLKQIITVAAPGLNKLWQNGRMMAGFIAPNVNIEKSEYEHLGELYPNVLGKIDTSPDCDEPPLAQSVRKVNVSTTGPEEYDTTKDKDQSPFYLITNPSWIASLPIIGTLCSLINGCNLTANPPLVAYEKVKTPYIDKINLNLANDPSGKAVGALATLIPDAFRFPNEHGKVDDQNIAQTIGDGNSNHETLKASINYKLAGGLEKVIDVANCLVRPDGELQNNLGYSCNFSENDVTADRPLDGGTDPNFLSSDLGTTSKTINDAAATGGIPACVLEGVKYAETGTRTDFSGECRVNECSAAGPFQVTTGWVRDTSDQWSNYCSQCGSGKQCPDGWLNNWPKTASDPSPCEDVKAAADRAAQILQEKAFIRCEKLDPVTTRSIQDQKTAIITAAGSYYGSNVPIERFGGCSYGEFVYKHCDSSYLCGTANVDLAVKYEQCHPQNAQ